MVAGASPITLEVRVEVEPVCSTVHAVRPRITGRPRAADPPSRSKLLKPSVWVIDDRRIIEFATAIVPASAYAGSTDGTRFVGRSR